MGERRTPRIVLASASPRRAALLSQIGIDFVVKPANVDEALVAGESPQAHVERLARKKALAVAQPGSVTVAADTVVVVGGEVLGKPVTRSNALWMLGRLSGRDHLVVTGVAATDGDRLQSLHVASEVSFRPIPAWEAEAYWQSGEPGDKAGGYGIQGIGGIFARSINGSYTAVVGLPLSETEDLLREFGVDTWRSRINV